MPSRESSPEEGRLVEKVPKLTLGALAPAGIQHYVEITRHHNVVEGRKAGGPPAQSKEITFLELGTIREVLLPNQSRRTFAAVRHVKDLSAHVRVLFKDPKQDRAVAAADVDRARNVGEVIGINHCPRRPPRGVLHRLVEDRRGLGMLLNPGGCWCEPGERIRSLGFPHGVARLDAVDEPAPRVARFAAHEENLGTDGIRGVLVQAFAHRR